MLNPITHTVMRTTTIPYGPSFPDNTRRFEHLQKVRVKLQANLHQKVNLALEKCNPNMSLLHKSNKSCAIIWDEIEEYSAKISEIDENLQMYWECWDEMECKMYDV